MMMKNDDPEFGQDFFWEDDRTYVLPEPHCRVCATMYEDDMWLMDIPPRPSLEELLGPDGLLFMREPYPDQVKDGMVTFKISRPSLPSTFLADESYAREANEFGY
jgi:hypothetical protein